MKSLEEKKKKHRSQSNVFKFSQDETKLQHGLLFLLPSFGNALKIPGWKIREIIWGITYLSSTYYLLIIYLLSIYLSITYQSCILYVVFTFLTLFHSKQMKNRGLTFLQRFCSRIHTFTITLKYCSFYYWLVCPNFSPKSFATLEPIAWTSPVLLPPTSAMHFPCPFSGNTTSNICV